MDFKNLLPATNRDELRQWLSENHNTVDTHRKFYYFCSK